MVTIDELRALAREIRDERQIGGNTGARVGNTFDKVADLLESTGGDISDIREAVEQLLQDVGFIPRDVSRTATDAGFTNSEGELLFWLSAATDTLAGLITAANNNKLIALPTAEELAQALAEKQNRLTFDQQPIEGSTNPVTSDGINTAIANFVTRSVSDLIYYYTKSETYTKEEVNALVAAIKQFVPVVAQTLPTPSADTMYKLYLIPSEDPQEGNIKDEYITIDNGASANPRYTWEKIGSVDIDISGKADIGTVPANVTRTASDATFVNNNHDPLFYLRQATSSLAGLMTSAEHNKLDALPTAQDLNTQIEGIIYDVSSNHPTAGPNHDGKFTLAYILNPNNVDTLIPTAVRKGGMSIKFVQTSDNRYVQYRLMSDTFSTTESDWENIDDKLAQKTDSVEIPSGKNLFNKNNLVNGYISTDGGLASQSDPRYKVSSVIAVKPNTTYYVTFPTGVAYKGVRCLDSNGNQLKPLSINGRQINWNAGTNAGTAFIPPTDAVGFQFQVKFNDEPDIDVAQVELGDTATEYEAFIGKKELDPTEFPSAILQRIENNEHGIDTLEENIDTLEENIDTLEETIGNKADLVKIVTSRNLFDKNNLANGYIDLQGGLTPETDKYWCSSLIPVEPNTVYYITYPTGVNEKYGRCVTEEETQVKPLNLDDSEINWNFKGSKAFKTPATAKYFQFTVAFNQDIPDLDTAQLELGDEATTPVPYTSKKVLVEEELPPAFDTLEERVSILERDVKRNTLVLDLGNRAISYILSDFNSTHLLKQTLSIISDQQNGAFNFWEVYLVNKQTLEETYIKNVKDDIAPPFFHSDGGHIGGNHGAECLNKVTVASHDKTVGDIGSIWSDGNNQFTLAMIETGYLYFIGENTLTYPAFGLARLQSATGTLTHVSGATHTSDVSYTAKSLLQWWPFYKSVPRKSIYLDDVKVTQNGTYDFNIMKVAEDYDILNPASVLTKIQEGVGTFTTNPTPQDFALTADLLLHISNVYTFNSAAECMVASNLCIYQGNGNLSHYGFTQCFPLSGNNKKIYMPKAKSKNNGATPVNYRTIADYSDASGLIRVHDYEVPNLPPDRVLVFDDNIGLHLGYLFDYGVGGTNRLDSIPANSAGEVAGSGKLYPYGWAPSSSPDAYANKSAVCFRMYIDRASINTNGVISISVFEYNNKCYIYADFNAAGNYEIEIPSKYQGGQIEVLEKRDNVELLTQNASEKILIRVSQDDVMYGYFVGRI